jgi:HK97 family phage major capsid protein
VEKTIAEQLADIKAQLEALAKDEVKAYLDKIQPELKAIETKANKEDLDKFLAEIKDIKEAIARNEQTLVKTVEATDKMQAESKHFTVKKEEAKTFNQILDETIERNAEDIKNFRRGELRMPFYPEVKADSSGKLQEVKTVGDMSITNNFPAGSTIYSDRRGLVETPYNMVALADILPSSSSSGTNIIYPKENGGEGGVAPWTDYTQNKAQVDWDLTSATAYFKWLAGWVVVQRDMLDDIPFMQSYIRSRLLVSLKTAENDLIINGTTDTNPVLGFQDVAPNYNGSFTAGVDRIVDSAYGQIPDSTLGWYLGNYVVTNFRDLVKLGLNKASGSGEYNLPEGTVAFVNGRLQIGGIQTVAVASTIIPANTFYALDTRAFDFVRRIQPELRMFEDATLAKLNKIMFRVEERVTLICFNNNAIVKGVISSTS